jgi:hypothetical protein
MDKLNRNPATMSRADLSSLVKSARPGDTLGARQESVQGKKTLMLYLRRPGISNALGDLAGYGQTGRATAALWVASALDRFQDESLADVRAGKTHASTTDTVKRAITHITDAGGTGMIAGELSLRQMEKIANILVPPNIGDLMDVADSNPQKLRFQAFCERVLAEESFNFINAVSAFNAAIGPKGINVAKAEALVLEFIADPDHNATDIEREKYAPRQQVNLTHEDVKTVLTALRPLTSAKNFKAAIDHADAQVRHMLQMTLVPRFLKEDAGSGAG